MKLRNLFMAVVAGAAMLVGCDKEVDLGPAKVSLDQTSLAFEAAGGSQEVSLTATRDWAVSGVPKWVAVSPASGMAAVEAQPIKITVMENADYDHSATIVFTIGFARTSLTVKQAGPKGVIDNGDGSLDNPYNVAGVIAYVNDLGADVTSPKKVFVKGKVSAVDEEFTTNFGNGSFKISDDGTTAGAQFTAYRVLYLGNKKFTADDTQVQVGDEVIIYGNVVNYKGNTPETQQNQAFLYSLNGVDKGGAEGGSGETGEPEGTGTVDDPFNVAAAINAVKDLTWTSTTEYDKVGPYYVKGIVKSIGEAYGTQFGNGTFYIKDADTDNEFYVYRALYLNNKKFAAGDTALAEGDEVIIYGELMNYRGNTPETVMNSCYLYSLNGNTGSDSGTGETGEAKGTGTVNDPYNPAGANAFIKTLAADTESENDVYVKGIISSIQFQYKADDYGNGTFYITEDGKADSESFYCFRVLYLNNQKFTANDTPVKVGDEVVICGKVVNYKGNTPETAGNKAYLYSLVPGEGGEEQEPGEDIEGYTIKLTNENAWTAGSDATYGSGFETTVEGIKIGVYKHASTTTIVTPDQYSARVYKGAVISITAPEGVNMTGIQFQANDYNNGQYCKDLTVLEGGSGTIKANATTYKVGPWNGTANKVVFQSPDAQSRLTSVTIAFDGGFNPGGGESGGDKVTTIAGIVAQIPDTATGSSSAADYEAELTGAVVSYVNGNNAYLEDASGAILLYLANHGLAAGDVISGKVSGKGYYFNGLPEITAIGTEYTKTAGGTIPETEMTIAALMDNYSANMSRRIKITGVTVTDAIADGDRNGAIKQGDASIAVYASLNNKGLVLAENATGDFIAFPTVYSKNGTTTYQLSFWDNSQFTATGGGTTGGETGGGEPGGNEPEGGIYASSVTWTLGNKAYSEKAIVNDVENVPVLKLGNSSTIGTATLTIPSGATKITFYAVSWSGKPSKLVFKNGDTELGSVSPAANTGLANISPYTLTVTDADKYEIAVSGATSITVQTDGSNKRAALFAIVSE